MNCEPLRFPVRPRGRFNCGGADFSQIKVVGEYSLDSSGDFCDDPREVFCFVKDYGNDENITVDLNTGYDPDNSRIYIPNGLETFLYWIIQNDTKVNLSEIDFVGGRGIMRKLLETPYTTEVTSWSFLASRYKGTIYLQEDDVEKMIEGQQNMPENQKISTYRGRRFENFMTTDDLDDMNVQEEYRVVVRSTIGGKAILCHAKVDGAFEDEVDPKFDTLSKFVELKTTLMIMSEANKNYFYTHILRGCWCRLHMIGIPTVIFGFRDGRGVVRNIKKLPVEEFPKKAMNWEANVILNFMDQFLDFVKASVEVDDPNYVYRFTFAAGADSILCKPLGTSGKAFLPDRYVKHFSD